MPITRPRSKKHLFHHAETPTAVSRNCQSKVFACQLGMLRLSKTFPPFFGMQLTALTAHVVDDFHYLRQRQVKMTFGSCGKDYSKTLVCSISVSTKTPTWITKKMQILGIYLTTQVAWIGWVGLADTEPWL